MWKCQANADGRRPGVGERFLEDGEHAGRFRGSQEDSPNLDRSWTASWPPRQPLTQSASGSVGGPIPSGTGAGRPTSQLLWKRAPPLRATAPGCYCAHTLNFPSVSTVRCPLTVMVSMMVTFRVQTFGV